MNKKDLITMFLPVLICIAIMLFPSSLQQELSLNSIKLTWWSVITNAFVHQNWTHLFWNMVVYLASTLIGYSILSKDDRKRFSLLIIYLIIFSILGIFIFEFLLRSAQFIPQTLDQRGFSGVSSASLGFLCFALSRRIQIRLGLDKRFLDLLNLFYFFFIPSLAIMVWNLSKIFAVLVFFFWFLVVLVVFLPQRKNKSKINGFRKSEVLILGLCMAFLFFGIGLMVPSILSSNGSVVDIVAHFIGFLIGAIMPLLWFGSK